jgi:hypothetical protein
MENRMAKEFYMTTLEINFKMAIGKQGYLKGSLTYHNEN